MNARERFELTRQYVQRLHEVQLALMFDCDDWAPPTIRANTEKPDPTAKRAIYNVDELESKLASLRREESELIEFIGVSLGIIEGVRKGFGEVYANLLEWRYIDGMTVKRISEDKNLNRTYCYELLDVAFDWIDSVGVSRILKGEAEI